MAVANAHAIEYAEGSLGCLLLELGLVLHIGVVGFGTSTLLVHRYDIGARLGFAVDVAVVGARELLGLVETLVAVASEPRDNDVGRDTLVEFAEASAASSAEDEVDIGHGEEEAKLLDNLVGNEIDIALAEGILEVEPCTEQGDVEDEYGTDLLAAVA